MPTLLIIFLTLLAFELIVLLAARREIRRGDRALPASAGVPSGGEVAREVLRRAGVSDVAVVDGDVDAYLLRARTIQLADGRLERSSVSAAAIAAHEAAHAVQHASDSRVFRVASALMIPAAIALFLIVALIVAIVAFDLPWLIWPLLVLLVFEVVAGLFTCAVEVDASRKAMASLRDLGIEINLRRARVLLVLCGLTYVMETVSDIGFIGRYLSRDEDGTSRWGSAGGDGFADSGGGCGGGGGGGD